MSETDYAQRCRAIHLLRSGSSPAQAAAGLGRSVAWVYKWQARYRQGSWEALQDQSRAPKHRPRATPERVKQAIRETRSELEAAAQQPGHLTYIGARAILSRLCCKQIRPLPSISVIERELHAAGLTRPRRPQEPSKVDYPHLKPSRAHQLVQADIVPHYLPGGQCVACFNALDVVSRYPTGQPSATKRAEDAVHFLLHVWRELGVSDYTQVDNEAWVQPPGTRDNSPASPSRHISLTGA